VPIMFDVTDAEDIAMLGETTAKEVIGEVDAKWHEPEVRRGLAMIFGGMPPQVMDTIKQRHPKAYQRVMDALERGKQNGA